MSLSKCPAIIWLRKNIMCGPVRNVPYCEEVSRAASDVLVTNILLTSSYQYSFDK
ncbi:hypothetical protein C2845_PM15G03520 [Panicum miliaceum]|uniref:Uncharacterized protein n=1 Tax=Panicum miliaceum TaxID=4540 RepID=A0A3L6Q5H1_PANMI|nr:hypothetical protein C2845_PM15G03520 [Panicum miliaceum]